MIGPLIPEIDIRKQDVLSKLLPKAPNPKDIEIKQRLNALRNFRNYRPGGGGPLPPPSPPCPPPKPSHPPSNFQTHQTPRNITPYLDLPDFPDFPPAPPPEFFTTQTKTRPTGINKTQTFLGDKLIGELERVIEKEKKAEEKIEDDDSPVDYLDKALEVLEYEFLLEQETKQRELEELKKDYDFETLFKKINEGEVPEELEFYFGGENQNFLLKCMSLNLNHNNINFIDFLSSDYCSQIMRESKISIHMETENIYCDNLNTEESLYYFLANQQEENKKSCCLFCIWWQLP